MKFDMLLQFHCLLLPSEVQWPPNQTLGRLGSEGTASHPFIILILFMKWVCLYQPVNGSLPL
jgi:hypothetical protein